MSIPLVESVDLLLNLVKVIPILFLSLKVMHFLMLRLIGRLLVKILLSNLLINWRKSTPQPKIISKLSEALKNRCAQSP